MATVRIGAKVVGTGQPCLVVAELGLNHDGQPAKAELLIEQAASIGADAVKFQRRCVDRLLAPEGLDAPYSGAHAYGATYGEHRRALELPDEAWPRLKALAESLGLLFFSSAWDGPSVDFLEALGVPCHKLPSACLTDSLLVDYAAQKGHPLILSTGMSTRKEVEAAVRIVERHHDRLALLHCVSSYPAENCLHPDTLIALADLSWKRLGDIKVDDELIGFDEQLKPDPKMRLSRVLSVSYGVLPCHRIVTEFGEVIASDEHLWVCRAGRASPYLRTGRLGQRGGQIAIRTRGHISLARRTWIPTKDLTVGDVLTLWCQPWPADLSHGAGYLAGFLDGEGHIVKAYRRPEGHGRGAVRGKVGATQNSGPVLDYVVELLRERGFHPIIDAKGTMRQLRFVRDESLRLLGQIRPGRLLLRSREVWQEIGTRWPHGGIPIKEIVPCGQQPIVGLTTTTGTLIANGFLSHNSDLNLRVITTYRERYPYPVGWSGHERDLLPSLAAVALGACLVERHFTLDRTAKGPDHRASLEPDDFKRLVEGIREVEAALGDGVKRLSPSELAARRKLAKSVVLKVSVRRRHIVMPGDIELKEPGTGVPAAEVVGSVVRDDVTSGTVLRPTLLKRRPFLRRLRLAPVLVLAQYRILRRLNRRQVAVREAVRLTWAAVRPRRWGRHE